MSSKKKKQSSKGDKKQYQLLNCQTLCQPTVISTGSKICMTDGIQVAPFTLRFGDVCIFEDACVNLPYKNKYGVVGINGCGKSSFLKLISEKKLAGIDPNLDILYVEQELLTSDLSVIESVLNVDEELVMIRQKEKELESSDNHDELLKLYEEFTEINVDAKLHLARRILAGLQFSEEMQEQQVCKLSGGWRMRISLARALFRKPEILILDEPTNHLDFHAVVWLTDYLQKWKNTLLLVSHDIEFLNNVTDKIVSIESKKIHLYNGNYKYFVEAKKKRDTEFANSQIKIQNKIKAIKQSINKLKPDQKIKKIGEMRNLQEQLLPSKKIRRVTFEFNDANIYQESLVKLSAISKTYNNKRVLSNVNLEITSGSKIGVIGKNGSGKSTLMNIVSGSVIASSGTVETYPRANIAHFSQHFVDELELDVSPVQLLNSKFPNIDYQILRKTLGTFGLESSLHVKSIQSLSGGQRNRVAFALISLLKPDLMLLDEPTNHLDLDSVTSLIESLQNYEGAVLIISHNIQLLNEVCDKLLLVENTSVLCYEGSIYDYRDEILNTI